MPELDRHGPLTDRHMPLCNVAVGERQLLAYLALVVGDAALADLGGQRTLGWCREADIPDCADCSLLANLAEISGAAPCGRVNAFKPIWPSRCLSVIDRQHAGRFVASHGETRPDVAQVWKR